VEKDLFDRKVIGRALSLDMGTVHIGEHEPEMELETEGEGFGVHVC
jgi:hypothetical protein